MVLPQASHSQYCYRKWFIVSVNPEELPRYAQRILLSELQIEAEIASQLNSNEYKSKLRSFGGIASLRSADPPIRVVNKS